nr:C-terminal helicase domain-containing protein [Bartonella rattimassiliensis]
MLGQEFTDRNGITRPITEDDILVVTPYNVQVNYLRSILPDNAKVDTVDKFQGQEAPIVLISMVTSSVEDLPRNIEFLYSKNRLNVAVSCAQCLAVVVANPKLLEIPGATHYIKT